MGTNRERADDATLFTTLAEVQSTKTSCTTIFGTFDNSARGQMINSD